jgi:arsenite methyltransferase
MVQSDSDIKTTIRERYGTRARNMLGADQRSCCGPETSCCGSTPQGVNAFSQGLYAVDELDGVPLQTSLTSLGCANPIALSELHPGETVLDIGSGGGLDALLAARRVGPSGHAYGLDMTSEMLELAWKNALDANVNNVTFLKGEVENIPIPDNSIDVVISNCVINLSPDKERALSEIYRVLRPGGRLAIADVVIKGGLPERSPITTALRGDPEAWGSCLAGALTDEQYEARLHTAGFRNVALEVVRTHNTEELLGTNLPAWAADFPRDALEEVTQRFTSSFIRGRKPTEYSDDKSKEDRSALDAQKNDSSSESQHILEAYDSCATAGASTLCCSPAKVYSPEELARLPEEVLRLSSSCGTPVTDAGLQRGTTVIDIGSGAGMDCFLAAELVGPEGTVIGIDPSPAMREIANRHRDELKLTGVSFVEGTAERVPVPDASADVVISNCVLSLASDPSKVWREIARILRPGGRFVISDVLGGVRPATLESKTQCECGLTWREYREILAHAHFTAVEPLRVRSVAFRDGYQAQSVTVQGRAGFPAGRSLQIFAPSAHQETAQHTGELLSEAAKRRGAELTLRIVNLDTENGDQLLRIISESEAACGERRPALAIAGEGRLIATCEADANGEVPAIEAVVELALDFLIDDAGNGLRSQEA